MLWYDKEAEEAANFYCSVFKNSKVHHVSRYSGGEVSERSGQPAGTVMTVEFEIDGQRFVALNAGPMFKFTEAVSFVINCEDQEEVDYYWEKLTSDGGQESMCGWLKDKYGLSWQVTPTRVIELLKDPSKTPKVMEAVLQMRKLDIAKIEAAASAT
jgi:predicted 3-demethylubiquinone-9 3-methyltransferase (glyoxalase superfamily)